VVKAESLQRTGSFKLRGGANALAALSETERERGVVTFSAGNHGQAPAFAAQLAGVPATVVMPDAVKSRRPNVSRRIPGAVSLSSRSRGDSAVT
jgi:threonine dehydratase